MGVEFVGREVFVQGYLCEGSVCVWGQYLCGGSIRVYDILCEIYVRVFLWAYCLWSVYGGQYLCTGQYLYEGSLGQYLLVRVVLACGGIYVCTCTHKWRQENKLNMFLRHSALLFETVSHCPGPCRLG